MKIDRSLALIPVAAVAVALLGACDPGTGSDGASPAPVKTATASPTSAEDALKQLQKDNKKAQDKLKDDIAKASKSAAAAVPTGNLPNFVGMDLQDAQDKAQAAGFFVLNDKDATGQGRFQILDHDWKVCSQEPAPGRHGLEITVTMYAVKKSESC